MMLPWQSLAAPSATRAPAPACPHARLTAALAEYTPPASARLLAGYHPLSNIFRVTRLQPLCIDRGWQRQSRQLALVRGRARARKGASGQARHPGAGAARGAVPTRAPHACTRRPAARGAGAGGPRAPASGCGAAARARARPARRRARRPPRRAARRRTRAPPRAPRCWAYAAGPARRRPPRRPPALRVGAVTVSTPAQQPVEALAASQAAGARQAASATGARPQPAAAPAVPCTRQGCADGGDRHRGDRRPGSGPRG